MDRKSHCRYERESYVGREQGPSYSWSLQHRSYGRKLMAKEVADKVAYRYILTLRLARGNLGQPGVLSGKIHPFITLWKSTQRDVLVGCSSCLAESNF